jgi:hypothetical protein
MRYGPSNICPRCGGTLWRVRRRLFDRLVSLVSPRKRFRCYQCQWKGTIRDSKAR